ncbi:PRC-barrel domain-containing protein [uncultured Pelagimonas sp.]|uniref:PRC-barrel domain-containing protein n=1 Tax=uncultured Pelagimonas sp. TaxID=1618102 RepID=UPI0026203567|nr:PRC-barrel domain-containing protein [uncultured Pelagimonas sp.]
MKILTSLALTAALATVALPVTAQERAHVAGGVKLEYQDLDVQIIALGWSMKELLRGKVYNEQGKLVGYVNDAILSQDGQATFVIVNVAGFLNVGHKLIALPTPAFALTDSGDLVLPNATKDALESLPPFHYR